MPRFLLLAQLLACCLCAQPALAQPVDDRKLRFEPPSVDKVYPPLAPSREATDPAPPAPSPPAAPAPPNAPARPESTSPARDPASVPTPTAPPEQVAPLPQYGAAARTRVTDPGRRELPLEEIRDLPGAFGDPLRVVELMPGVVPVSSGLPYFYLRGSPPASQGYRYDGVLLPQIFHLGIGPQVLHPRMVGPVDFYGGVAPTNYGRRTGALIDTGANPHTYELGGELELRLLDLTGYVEAPVGRGSLQVAGRYGYPGLIFKAFSPETTLTYWDGQVRYELPLTLDDRLQVFWIGSFDDLEQPPFGSGVTETTAARLHFHRVVLRLLHETAQGELSASLRFGFDDSSLGTALAAKAFSLGPRVYYRGRFGAGHRVEVGADMEAATGDLQDDGGTISGIDGQLQVDLPDLAEASARSQGGAYTELTLATSDETRLTAGARVDVWKVRDVLNVGVDPRLRFSWNVVAGSQLHVGAGLAHQPTVFLLPLPGLSEVALSDRLTRSYQLEGGLRQELPGNVQLEVTPFFAYQDGVLLPELIVDGQIDEDPPLVDARAAGLELYAKGDVANKLRFIGSYTLGYGKAFSPPNVLGEFRPDFDVRHVLNLALAYHFPSGFNVGLRLGARSGRLIEQQNPRYAQRLPWFVRLDARVGYQWQGRWALMDVYLEWLNATAQREYLDADCFFGECRAESAPPIYAPNLGLRATFGS